MVIKKRQPEISPGCRLCRFGNWLCVYVTGRCTRNCYFCPQEKEKKDFPGFRAFVTDWIRFEDAEEVVSYLKHWHIKGLGISGGEPLLASGKVLKLVSCVKRVIPDNYIWIYTNGDLITKKLLLRLRKAGLDELRFDLAARNYDLKPLRLASGIINTLTVEVPVIPQDRDKLIEALGELEKIGVRHLNLQEATVTHENLKGFRNAGYSIAGGIEGFLIGKHPKGLYPLKGSLSSARYLAGYTRRHNMMLNAYVCTLKYKTNEQTQLMLRRMGKLNK